MPDSEEKKDADVEEEETMGIDMYPDEPQGWERNSGDRLWDEYMERLR